MFTKLAFLGIVCGLGTQPLVGEDDAKSVDVVQMLLSKDYRERQQAKELILKEGTVEEKAHAVSELTTFIDKPGNYSYRGTTVKAAILTLGELRAREAIDVLVEHIAFPLVPHPKTEELGPVFTPSVFAKEVRRRLPAVEALIQIGEPCIDEVVGRLAAAESTIEVRACRAVLSELHKDLVRAELARAIQRAAPSSRAQLKRTLQILNEKSTPRQ